MSAPRVPPGWSREAADRAWEDWRSVLEGGLPAVEWTSPEARLRAWAAVGAPVLAPAEDGRPSDNRTRTDLLPVRIEDAERTIREEVDRFAHIFGEDSQFVVRTRVALATLRDCALTARRRE